MSAATMTTTTSIPNGPEKKRYAREMTEKRREQNRRSQKIYREKLKKKLEELEEQVQSKTQVKQGSSPEEATVREILEHMSTSAASSTPSRKQSNVIDLNAAFAAAGDLALPTDTTLPSFELGFRDRRTSQSRTPSTAPSPADPITPNDAPIPKFLAIDAFSPADPGSTDMRLMWPIPIETWTEPYIPPTTKERRIPPKKFPTYTRNTSPLSHPLFSRRPTAPSSPSGMPSPYLNHLRLIGESAFSATLAIAASLGITRSAYVNDHPSPLGPWNDRPPIPPQPCLPKDLRPTAAQRALCHPGYLDCIVFPRFRSAAIVLSARGELDHCALFLDLIHDGLVCWGGTRADGVAWSRRSWEARPWFLRRWGWLCAIDPTVVGIGLARGAGVVVDEEEHDADGMFEGSRWWRGMRGETLEGDEEEEEDGMQERAEEHGEMLSRHVTCNIGVRDVREFAGAGMLWPTQFQDRMALKLQSVGLTAPSAMELGEEATSAHHLGTNLGRNPVAGFGLF